MEYVILGLLHQQGMTVYILNKIFKNSVSLFYGASLGNIQSALKKMLEKRWVEVEECIENGRSKKVYTLTLEGRQAFSSWMEDAEFEGDLEKIMLAKVYFLGLIDSTEKKEAILKALFNRVEAEMVPLREKEKVLEQLKVSKEQTGLEFYEIETLKYGIGAYQYALKWLKSLSNNVNP